MNQPLIAQLFNPEFGSVTSREDQPDGLDEFTITRKRGKDNDGFIYEFSINLSFYKALGQFISDVFSAKGSDGFIGINIYSENPNTYDDDIEYQGQLQLDNYNQDDDFIITTNVEPVGFQRKFLNLEKRNVNMRSSVSRLNTGIGAAPVTVLNLPPKAILQRYEGRPIDENESAIAGLAQFDFPSCGIGPCDFNRSTVLYASIDNNLRSFDDFQSTQNQNYSWDEIAPSPFHIVTPQEAGITDLDLISRIRHRVTANASDSNIDVTGCGNSELGQIQIETIFEHRDADDNSITNQVVGTDYNIPFCPDQGNDTFTSDFETKQYQDQGVTLNVGDKLYFYFRISIGGNYTKPGATGDSFVNHEFGMESDNSVTSLQVETKTIFPATDSEGYLVYEFLEQIIRSLTDQVDCFRSEFFGRTDSSTPYPQDGEGSLLFITNGGLMRQIQNKILFGNWQDAFQSLNSLFCIGWGFETLPDGTQVVRCEKKQYFYDRNTVALESETIEDLQFFLDNNYLFGEIKAGYPQVENINQINGIDEFNSERIYSSPLTTAKQDLDIRSVYRASGFEIESQRRLSGSTEESKLDDENFFIGLKRDGGGFAVEQGSDFELIQNVFDPDSAYNVRISPARNFRRWSEYLASNILRSDNKTFAFTFGDYNYLMTSKLTGENTVAEDADLTLTNDLAYFYPEGYTLVTPIGTTERRLVNDNIRGTFKTKNGKGQDVEGYFVVFEDKIAESKGDLTILRVYRPPV